MSLKSVKTLGLSLVCALALSVAGFAQNTNGNMNGNTNGNMNGNTNGNMNGHTHTNRRNPSPRTPRRVRRGRNTNPGTRRGPINTNTGGNTNNGNTR